MDRLRNMLIFCLFVNKLFDKWMDLLACGLLDFDLVLIGYFTRKKENKLDNFIDKKIN